MSIKSANRIAVALFASSMMLVPMVLQQAHAAQKKEQCFVKTNFKSVVRSVQQIGDVPNHELVQEQTVYDIKYTNPDFKTKSEWAMLHADLIDGSGPHSGYYYDLHEDGSVTYGAFRGRVKTVSNPDGTWEATWEGTYEYVGGSGMFKRLKGAGTYKGKASSSDPSGREEGCETVEY